MPGCIFEPIINILFAHRKSACLSSGSEGYIEIASGGAAFLAVMYYELVGPALEHFLSCQVCLVCAPGFGWTGDRFLLLRFLAGSTQEADANSSKFVISVDFVQSIKNSKIFSAFWVTCTATKFEKSNF